MRPHSARSSGPARSAGPAGRLVALLTGVLLLATAAAPATSAQPVSRSTVPSSWTGTWATTPTATPASDTTEFADETIRQTVRTSIGGDRVRVRLSNEFGSGPLVIGEARVARPAAGGPAGRIDPRTDRPLTFGGRTSVTVPAGSPLLSDPVSLRVPAGTDLVVSIHLPVPTPGSTLHAFAQRHNYVAAGNVTGRTDIEPTATVDRWYFLTGVSVSTGAASSAVVTLGDSITDGAETEVGADHRWPDFLARRLRASAGPGPVGVLNEGVSGNRLLHDPNPPAGSDAEDFAAYFGQSALRRFDRDVASQPGARHLIVLLGVNDLGHPGTVAPASERVTAADLIEAHRQIIARAHDRGLKAYGGTVLPFKGDTLGFYTPENEAARQALNHWIRTGGEYDAVIDFDRALRDPSDPQRLLARYDSGDHLHPDDAGAEAMARAVPLRLLR
ncbi:Lysophospholipase L1 [Streptomyces sp. LamerLS-316]|uniref:SGNH/GDSL hydrolase family protein n=1 Tax=unclassified Streptomyces TaxID=2593676 RepID=UPI000823B479|nr:MULTISPECIES: SGNH/GDSL hydrolase family protein [unclassified Streptomyces]MYQ41949.1 SGNH/GDSL hydrolase family protein [Streptomyces sp. SID4921]SCK29431.1 Lysophospholipase L1 [Streptomyces sp. LamerLS-316]